MRNQDFSQLQNCKFRRVAEIDGSEKSFGRSHHPDQAIDHVVNITEGTGLGTIAEDGNVFAPQGLNDKIADHATVVRAIRGP